MTAFATQAACMAPANSHGNATAKRVGEVSSVTKVSVVNGAVDQVVVSKAPIDSSRLTHMFYFVCRSQLLHTSQTVSEWSHLHQHRPGKLHLLLQTWLHWGQLWDWGQRMLWQPVQKWRKLHCKFLLYFINIISNLYVVWVGFIINVLTRSFHGFGRILKTPTAALVLLVSMEETASWVPWPVPTAPASMVDTVLTTQMEDTSASARWVMLDSTVKRRSITAAPTLARMVHWMLPF